MASTIEKTVFIAEEPGINKTECEYWQNREKIDAGIWNDYINDAVTPAPILLQMLERFRKNWRYEPKRHKILDDFF
jgi:hypothetical protein